MISPTGHVYLSYPYTYTEAWRKHAAEQEDSPVTPPKGWVPADDDPGPPPF